MERIGNPRPGPTALSEQFQTTRWSLVLQATHESSTVASAALEKLCRQYWPPLFAFARQHGYSEHDAQDLTQGFFAWLLNRNSLSEADKSRGRFRTFLLYAFRSFMTGDLRKRQAAKRGGSRPGGPVDAKLSASPPAGALDPGEEYDRKWARQVFATAVERLRHEFEAAGKLKDFSVLQPFLSQPGERLAYARAGAQLKLKPETVAVCVHRMRKRYGELVRLEVKRTVAEETDIDDELQHLMKMIVR